MTSTDTAFSDARALTGAATCQPGSFTQLATGDPQKIEPDGAPTWIARAANFVVAVTSVQEGTEIFQDGVRDESMLLLSPAVPVTIHADGRVEEVDEEALAILPPGRARIVARGAGTTVRIFSNAATAMLDLAGNAADFAGSLSDVAPLTPWPDPVDGFRLRIYRLRDHSEDVGFGRIFRSANLMVNIFEPSQAPRDPARLSPHDHADFEQGSLTIAGDFTHYLRTPWGADSTRWRADQTVPCSGLSLMVIPPKMIHTTGWSTTDARLVDIFAPPREDFSLKPRWVRNADDYPMPGKEASPDTPLHGDA